METNQRLSLTETINVSTTDPSHLFWVPASYHPEISPTEFEKHVKALRVNVMNDDKTRRRKSALSFSFTAIDTDISQTISAQPGQSGMNNQTFTHFSDDSDDNKNSTNAIDIQYDDELQNILDNTRRKQHEQQAFTSLVRSNSLHSLTENGDDDEISSLTNFSKSMENINTKDNYIKMDSKSRKGRVRRSMSLQLSDNTADPGNIPEFLVFDRNSAILDHSPVLISKTNRPLSRRGARTKFRKTSTTTLSRLKSMNVPPLPKQPTTEDTEPMMDNQQYQHMNLNHNQEPEMDTSGTSTLATITDDLDLNVNANTNTSDDSADQPPPSTDQSPPSLYPMTISSATTDTKPRPLSELPVVLHQSTGNSPPRERKSTWSWSFWTNEKKAKNNKAIEQLTGQEINDVDTKGQENVAPSSSLPLPSPSPSPSIMEPSSASTSKQRFGLSSLFSRKSSTPTATNFDVKNEKDKPQQRNSSTPNMPPKDFQLNKMNQQRRLPIHTERTMYRLSHMKLANSKRPLRDQVIISNFMFWYLSVINNQQQQQQQQQQNQPLVSFPEHDDANNNTNNMPSRPNMPRTPQQIIAASRKKKRLAKKNHQQKHTTAPAPPSSSTTTTTTSYQKKRSSSLNSSPHLRENTGQHHYSDKTSKNQTSSTGFVVPENYLRPASTDGNSNKSKQQQQHPGYARSNSWSSDDEDDDQDDDEDDDDSDDDNAFIGNGRHGRNEPGQRQQLHTIQKNISPSNQQQRHNRHPYNQSQQQQQQQHPQHYLISASAT